MRIRKGSSFDSFAIVSVLQYIYEVRVAYSWDESWIMRALFKIRMHHLQNSEFWKSILKDIKKNGLLNNIARLGRFIDDLEDVLDNQLSELGHTPEIYV